MSEVLSWLSSINCSGAHEIFQYHSIEGKDLLQISDTDLRVDFKIKRVHDRKYILRCIQDLKNSHRVIIEVEFADQQCSIRIPDVNTYSFENLRKDAARIFAVHPEKTVLVDKKGVVWGSVGISCIFDSNLRQQEPIFLEVIKNTDNTEQSEEDSKIQPSMNRSESPWLHEESECYSKKPKNEPSKNMFKYQN